jgi:hypothetical protein
MKPFFLVAGFLTIFTACQQSAKPTAETTADSSKATAILHAGPQCFTQVFKQDTAYLQFETDNEVVTGQLTYLRFEKDKNTGTITGTINDNIIDVEYHFMSEGNMSVRNAIFKLEDGKIYEATTDSLDKDGQPIFNKAALTFDTTPFVKGKCR